MKHSGTSGMSQVSVSEPPGGPGFEADLQLIYTMYTWIIPISLHCERNGCKKQRICIFEHPCKTTHFIFITWSILYQTLEEMHDSVILDPGNFIHGRLSFFCSVCHWAAFWGMSIALPVKLYPVAMILHPRLNQLIYLCPYLYSEWAGLGADVGGAWTGSGQIQSEFAKLSVKLIGVSHCYSYYLWENYLKYLQIEPQTNVIKRAIDRTSGSYTGMSKPQSATPMMTQFRYTVCTYTWVQKLFNTAVGVQSRQDIFHFLKIVKRQNSLSAFQQFNLLCSLAAGVITLNLFVSTAVFLG